MSLRVLTFNVFFDTTAQRLRSRALLEIARSSAAHVLLFQEVTRPFLRELQATDWVVRDFACSDADYTGALSWRRGPGPVRAWAAPPRSCQLRTSSLRGFGADVPAASGQLHLEHMQCICIPTQATHTGTVCAGTAQDALLAQRCRCPGATFDDYGVVSLARRDLSTSFKVVPMRSRMDRELLITAIDLPAEDSSGSGPGELTEQQRWVGTHCGRS